MFEVFCEICANYLNIFWTLFEHSLTKNMIINQENDAYIIRYKHQEVFWLFFVINMKVSFAWSKPAKHAQENSKLKSWDFSNFYFLSNKAKNHRLFSPLFKWQKPQFLPVVIK